ncbi:MAG: redoxin domain-containing protein [Planctomycetes bacterium]|nr:redoxin domain-containing protein [Planctomycetota bacterium]
MRVLACILVVGNLCLVGGGCALFKKSNNDHPAPATGGGAPPAKFPGSNDPILNSSGVPQANAAPVQSSSGSGAMLAGRVVDGYSKPPANTFIRLVSVDQKDAQPTEVAVTPDGYFTIQNLKSGGNYKLLARGKNGDRMLAGITYTSAPNVRLLIQVKEEFAGQNTPDVPPSPAYQGEKKQPEASKTSGIGSPSGEMEMPAVSVPTPSQTSSNPQGWSPSVVGSKENDWPPTLNIQPQKRPTVPSLQINDSKPVTVPSAPPARDVIKPTAPATEPLPVSTGPARVPSCVKVGRQVVNFALNDTHGEPWELRTSRKGKLVLLDFWWTECAPCLGALPDLCKLHQKFGGKGLEIVGIANESGGSFQVQALRVQSVCTRHQVPYKQLLAGGPSCPVRTQLEVQAFPTLVLLDSEGWIIWTHVGRPDQNAVTELDRLIQRRLGK